VVSGPDATVDHTYAQAGDYTVTLTVTDNEGAESAPVTEDVTVAGNKAPVARFTSSADRLQLSVDGSTSSDEDGSVASYAWDFGDGSAVVSGPDATVDHTYAQAGDYTVTLTVTDNEGAESAPVTQDVTVADVVVLARDTFERTVTSGLGTAEVGGNWTVLSTASDYSVSDGSAALRIPRAGVTRAASLSAVSALSSDVTARVFVDKPVTGGGLYLTLTPRGSQSDAHRGKIRIQSTGVLTASVQTVVGGVEKDLSVVNVPGLVFAQTDFLLMRVQVTGTNPTTVRMKVWKHGTAEPTSWLLTATDSTAGIQTAGGIAFRAYLSGSATNAPFTVRLDDLVAQVP
jgi:PKD repeat protein